MAAFGQYKVELSAPADVKDLLVDHLDLYRWQTDQKVTPDTLKSLIERVPQDASGLLNTAGYFSPKVEARLDEASTPPRVVVTVDPGELSRFSQIDFQLNGAIDDDEERVARLKERLQDNLAIKLGDPFTQSAWSDAKRRVLNSLQSSRYPTARFAKNEVKIDPVAHTAIATLIIDSGPLYRYGEITVEGLTRYPEFLVRNRIGFHEGDYFRRRDLLDLQSDLEAQPQFGGAVVEALPSESPPYVAPVTVRVQEVPMQRITLGAGYGTVAGPRGTVDYAYNNLFNKGWVFDTQTALDRDTQEFDAGITFPQQLSGYAHRVYTTIKRADVQGLLTRTDKIGVTRSMSEIKNSNGIDRQITLEYLFETRNPNDGTTDTVHSLTGNYRWIRRNFDSQRDPHQGNLLQLEGGGAVKGLFSDQTFVRLYGRGQQYWPIGEKGVLIGRLELGQTFTPDESEVPTDWLFRAGGSNSVRGYDYQSLGVPGIGAVLPGKVIATSSIELQYPVYKQWRGAVFADYGGAAEDWKALKMVTGVGAGARWISPVGVLGADLAYGIQARHYRFYFSLGLAF